MNNYYVGRDPELTAATPRDKTTQQRLSALRATLQKAELDPALLADHLALLAEFEQPPPATPPLPPAADPGLQLIDSRSLFEFLIKHFTNLAAVIFDRDLRYSEAGGPLLETVGYPREMLLGKTLYDLMAPEVVNTIEPYYLRTLEGETIHFQGEAPTGGVYELSTSPIFGVGGTDEVRGGLLMLRDVTKEQREAMMLTHYKNIITRTPDGFAIINKDYTYELVNYAYLRNEDLTPEAVAGLTVRDLVDDELFDNVIKGNLDRCFGGETVEYSSWFEFPTQGRRFVSVNYFPYFDQDGEITGAVVNTRDNTELIQMEEELQQNERRLRFTLNSTRVGTWEWNILTNDSSIDEQWAEMIGYTREELGTTTFDTWTSMVNPDDLKRSRALIDRHLTGEIPFYDCELRMRHKDGHWIWVWDQGMVMEWTDDGRPLRMFGTHIDITDSKKTELELREVNATLERANREVQQFAYIVSHDLRAPLINLKGFSEILSKSLRQISDLEETITPRLSADQLAMWQSNTQNKIPKALGFIIKAVDRMDQYTSAILKLSRLGKHQLVFQKIDTDRLVNQIIESLDPQIADRQITVQLDNLPAVTTDRIALDQIFNNILTNAVKYVDLDRPGRIHIFAEQFAHQTIFSVSDNGRGIAESDQPKIFCSISPGRPADRTWRGDGLGLCSGAYLPFARGYQLSVGSRGRDHLLIFNSQAAGGNVIESKHVLIVMVEDNDGHAALIEMNLRDAGLANPIQRLADGQAAIEFINENTEAPADGAMLVLLDLNLPVIDGYGVLEALKSREETRHFPIIVLTSTDDEREIKRCYELGCNVYLRKPVHYGDFVQAVQQLGLFISVIEVPGSTPNFLNQPVEFGG